MIAAMVASTVAPPSVFADAISDKKAQAAALAEQINADAHQVDMLSDQYDGAEYHLTQVQQQLTTAAQQLKVARATDQKNLAALSSEAVVAYMQGGFTPTDNMTLGGSTDLTVADGYFQLATGNQVDALDQLRQSEQVLRQQQQALQVARQNSVAALAQVSSSKNAVQAASAATQAELAQVQGSLVQLVAEQQAQMAAQQVAEERSALLAVQSKLAATGIANVAAPAVSNKPSVSASVGGISASVSVPRSTAPLSVLSVPPTAPPTAPSPAPSPAPPPAPPPNGGAAAAVAYARAQLGKPYQWGAAGPNSFDCSGLTMMAWEAGGVSLPHYAAAQYADTAHVPIADLEPGDLVFFYTPISHVGLYVGGGEMIDAPNTGSFVRYDSIFWPGLQPYGGRP